MHDVGDTPEVLGGEQPTAPWRIPPERSCPVSADSDAADRALSASALVEQCQQEIQAHRRGEPFNETQALELLRRAIVQGDEVAWARVQQCLGEVARGWLLHHPSREAACRLESEENYVAQAFERFWRATTVTRRVEFSRLAAALQYLRASLNGAILDTLRASSRPREVSLPEPGKPAEPHVEDQTDSNGVWKILQTMLPSEREQRLAYLLYHCNLKPREIVRFCQEEWTDVQEIYRLRRNILERLVCHTDQLC